MHVTSGVGSSEAQWRRDVNMSWPLFWGVFPDILLSSDKRTWRAHARAMDIMAIEDQWCKGSILGQSAGIHERRCVRARLRVRGTYRVIFEAPGNRKKLLQLWMRAQGHSSWTHMSEREALSGAPREAYLVCKASHFHDTGTALHPSRRGLCRPH